MPDRARFFQLDGGLRVRVPDEGPVEITRWYGNDDEHLSERLTITPEQVRELADRLRVQPTARQVQDLARLVAR